MGIVPGMRSENTLAALAGNGTESIPLLIIALLAAFVAPRVVEK